ncbi:helix-turn-helix transcriptional regulator [Undibacterium sp. Di26W]|uniref:helix-turn-helix transcriptional regulator n=1 Tax=Undibacterium sp. Di26W TaxID=3413035 RepID=UPI003BF07373
MKLHEIGAQVKEKRIELGLTQAQVAKLAGLSRTTINQLESGVLPDLGYSKLLNLLAILGLDMDAKPSKGISKALEIAARTASTSYSMMLSSSTLENILAAGIAPVEYHPHLMTLLEETPLPIVVKAIQEASMATHTSTRTIMRNVSKFARDLHIYRKVW